MPKYSGNQIHNKSWKGCKNVKYSIWYGIQDKIYRFPFIKVVNIASSKTLYADAKFYSSEVYIL